MRQLWFTNLLLILSKVTFAQVCSVLVVVAVGTLAPACNSSPTAVGQQQNAPQAAGITTQALHPAPELGLVVDRNLVVLHVEARSAAEQAGIQVNDTITGLDNAAVTDMQDFRQRVRQVQDRALNIAITRAGQSLSIQVTPARPIPDSGPNVPSATPVPQDQMYV